MMSLNRYTKNLSHFDEELKETHLPTPQNVCRTGRNLMDLLVLNLYSINCVVRTEVNNLKPWSTVME